MEPHFLPQIPGGHTHQLWGSSDENLRHRKHTHIHTRAGGSWRSRSPFGAISYQVSTIPLSDLAPHLQRNAEHFWGSYLQTPGHPGQVMESSGKSCRSWVCPPVHTRKGIGQPKLGVPYWNCPLYCTSNIFWRRANFEVSCSGTKCFPIA